MVDKKVHFPSCLGTSNGQFLTRVQIFPIVYSVFLHTILYIVLAANISFGHFVKDSEIKDWISPSGCWNWWGCTAEFGRKKMKWGQDDSIPWSIPPEYPRLRYSLVWAVLYITVKSGPRQCYQSGRSGRSQAENAAGKATVNIGWIEQKQILTVFSRVLSSCLFYPHE